jgi:DNA polymerase III sliding clamp (beta) subunit (PCNA family)
MNETKTTQTNFFGEKLEELVRVETTGQVICPFKRMVDQIAAEYKLQFTDEGLTVAVDNSWNVALIKITLPEESFKQYDLHRDVTLGTTADSLGNALKHARYDKSANDSVTLNADRSKLRSQVTRDIQGYEAEINEQAGLIHPNSIREIPDFPDLKLDAEVEFAPDAFVKAIRMFSDNNAIKMKSSGDAVKLHQKVDDHQREVSFELALDVENNWTYFTAEYLHQFATALNNGYVDELTLRWSEDMPLVLEFEREDVYSGTLLLAPHIKK